MALEPPSWLSPHSLHILNCIIPSSPFSPPPSSFLTYLYLLFLFLSSHKGSIRNQNRHPIWKWSARKPKSIVRTVSLCSHSYGSCYLYKLYLQHTLVSTLCTYIAMKLLMYTLFCYFLKFYKNDWTRQKQEKKNYYHAYSWAPEKKMISGFEYNLEGLC